MRQRIISSLVGLVILGVVFFFFDTLLLNFALGFIGVVAVLELLAAVKCIRFKSLSALSIAIATAIPFVQEKGIRPLMPQIMFALIVILFIILLKHHDTLRVEQAAMMFFFSIFVPTFFSCGIFLRNHFGSPVGGIYVLWALGSAWLSDSGAYFTGIAIGKHKLAPKVSPKKTIEGSIGGLVTATALMPLVAFLYGQIMRLAGTPIAVNYPLLLLLTPFFSLIGILGDLSASVIKRQFGIKDFGNIMPGHGGILDRFDSVLFTLPAVFIAVEHLAVITAI